MSGKGAKGLAGKGLSSGKGAKVRKRRGAAAASSSFFEMATSCSSSALSLFSSLPRLTASSFSPLPPTPHQGTLGAGKGATGDKKKPVSRSARAGLTFPVGRVHRQLKLRATANGRVGATAAVYSAAILGELRCFFWGRGGGAERGARAREAF